MGVGCNSFLIVYLTVKCKFLLANIAESIEMHHLTIVDHLWFVVQSKVDEDPWKLY